MRMAFVVSGCLATLAAIVVIARLDPDVKHDAHADEGAPSADAGEKPGSVATPASFGTIVNRIKTSCFGTFAYGYFQASVVLFLPLYLRDQKHIAEDQTVIVPAFFAGGMLLFSNVAGRLGDRYGHLALMRVLAAIGTIMVLGFVFLNAFPAMCVAVFIAGATLASISPVSLALQGVVTEPKNYSRSNAVYNAFYAAGMLLGPWISSAIYDAHGGIPMLYHLAAIWAAFVGFTVVFYADDPAARRGTRAPAASQGEAVVDVRDGNGAEG
jgi:MFS family permease